MKALNANKKAYILADSPFAKGGEGAVFDVVGDAGLVAKLYHDKGQTREKEEKLRAMLSSPPQGISGQIAWPCDILYKPDGHFWGFVMPRVQNVTKIDSLYSYDRRCEHSYDFYLKVAQNLCAVVSAVHRSGHVCGDLNPANICVNGKTALVTLVDTDSYHIGVGVQQNLLKTSQHLQSPPKTGFSFLDPRYSQSYAVFKCPVCRPEYVPYEIQKIMNKHASLREATGETFTIYTDYFAVAIHIFALLMNGAHPYSCTVSGGVSASSFGLVNNIEKGIFAYENNIRGIGAPKYVPNFSSLPQNLQNLFIAAFGKNTFRNPYARPNIEQFHTALAQFETNLVRCGVNHSHLYDQKNTHCPLCEVENRMQAHALLAPKPIAGLSPVPISPMPIAPAGGRTSASYLNFGDRIGYVLGFLSGVMVFIVFMLLAMMIIEDYVTTMSSALLSIVLTLGILAIGPFIPMNLYNIVYTIFDLGDVTFFEGAAIALNKSLFLTYLLYIGVMAFSFWDSPFSLIINSFLICLLPTAIFKLLPFFTYDIMDTI